MIHASTALMAVWILTGSLWDELFENQIRYLLQNRKLKDQVFQEQRVIVTEEEVKQQFLNEKHHVGGELVVLDTKDEAEAFYEEAKDPIHWEAMKAQGTRRVRPVSLMNLQAIINLWGVPKEQIYAFHAMNLGSVGPPMPFGKKWGVFRLLEKRTGDLKDFPNERDAYSRLSTLIVIQFALSVHELVQKSHLRSLFPSQGKTLHLRNRNPSFISRVYLVRRIKSDPT